MNHDVEPHRYTLLPGEVDIVLMLLEQAPPGAVVEIGAFLGQTTVQLAPFAVFDGHPLHVIDPWDGRQDASDEEVYQHFLKAIEIWPEVIVHRQRAQGVTPPTPLAFVLEDGDHRRPDLARWYEALVPGGILVVHDIDDPGWPEVARAAARLPKPCFRFRIERPVMVDDPYGPGLRGLAWWIKPL